MMMMNRSRSIEIFNHQYQVIRPLDLVRIRSSTRRSFRAHGGGGGGGYGGAAEGAIRLRFQPGVNARRVERVVALGEEPERLAIAELGEADGALGSFDHSVSLPVLADGDRLDDRFF